VGKQQNYARDLTDLLSAYLRTGDERPLWRTLAANSNLPGPRGNLELADAFADLVGQHAPHAPDRLWQLCATMADLSADQAPTGTPEEFIPFCGAVGLGALGSACSELSAPAVVALRPLANDPRWRMREAVAMGLQRLLASRSGDVLQALAQWAGDGSWLELRAVAAGVAEPALLRDHGVALAALELHRTILARLAVASDRRSEEFKVLRQGLGYTLSVVVAALPAEGLAFMEELARTGDPDLQWIVRENFKKKRLAGRYPQQVEELQALLAQEKGQPHPAPPAP
jgi:hypothetical protein